MDGRQRRGIFLLSARPSGDQREEERVARYSLEKIGLIALLGVGVVILLAIYFPIGVAREFLQRDDKEGPAWMGEARARRRRLAIILGVFLAAGIGFAIYVIRRG